MLQTDTHDVIEMPDRFQMKGEDQKEMRNGQLHLAQVATASYFALHLLGQFRHQYPGVHIVRAHAGDA